MEKNVQMDDYSKYMTIAPLPEEILKSYEENMSGEEILEMGHRYFKGIDVEQDYEKAVRYYRNAAERGVADAYFALSLCFRDGKGVETDSEQERILLEKAMEIQRRHLCEIMGLEDKAAGFEIVEKQGISMKKIEHSLDADYKEILFKGTEKLYNQADIIKIVFSDSLDESMKACDYRDISQEKDGSVIGWVEKQGEEKCILHIDGKEKIGAPEDSHSLFAGYEEVEEIVFGEIFSTKKVTNMDGMFYGCGKLIQLDMRGFDTVCVTGMRIMFYGCSSLRSVDVSRFDTSNVTNMRLMFGNCSSLAQLNVRGFNTSNVRDMQGMFYDCESLNQLDVSGFDTSNVTNMTCMFYKCKNLNQLDVSRFDTSNVTDMSGMFYGCKNLNQLDVSGFDTSNVTDMEYMFSYCKNLNQLDAIGFDISNVKKGNDMFYGCNSLPEKYKHFDRTLNCSYKEILFEGSEKICDIKEIKKIVFSSSFINQRLAQPSKIHDYRDISEAGDGSIIGWLENQGADGILHISSEKKLINIRVSNGHALFEGFSNVKKIVFENPISTEGMTTMSSMFSGCSSLEQVDASRFVTKNVTDMSNMFYGCSSLKELNLSGFDTSNVTNMSCMFERCSSLEKLDVSEFVTENVTNMWRMFAGCRNLKELDVSGFSVEKLVEKGDMFTDCVSLPRKCKRLGGNWIRNWL